VSGYSGGCVRRLAAAAGLCRGAALALLDEPTAGVDVAARRRVWAALRRGLARRRAVLITSHRSASISIQPDIHTAHALS
jgi:ABC-type multidrug transport system ATPase subunit